MAFKIWLASELNKLIGIDSDSANDITNYIATFNEKSSLVSFLKELFSGNENMPDSKLDSKQREFLHELNTKWDRLHVPENVIVYKKDDEGDQGDIVTPNLSKLARNKSNPFDMSKINDALDNNEEENGKKTKKKTSYVSLYGKDGELKSKAVMLPGRYTCECQAQKHKLVNNCLKCGRVVCEQEGSGPCLFCGNLVCTREEKNILARNSHKSEKLYKQLMGIANGKPETKNNNIMNALEKARAYKDRLLNYDRTCAQRTKVIDDESDYFAADTNIWLNEKEREIFKQKEAKRWEIRHGSRLNKKVTLDFAGRRVVEEDESLLDDSNDQEFHQDETDKSINWEDFEGGLVNPTITGPKPLFISNTQEQDRTAPKLKGAWSNSNNRLQDPQLLEMSDPGLCLSMHQPWASLLIRGIKRDEGRSWYSKHRGRLWIAAAAKKPNDDEVSQVESQHEVGWRRGGIPGEKMPDLPTEYPVGCLLGCVHVKDVLEQEEYARQYPSGESGSPYVFVCENPLELTLKLPVKGQHKIWRLDPAVHKAAKRSLRY